MDGIFQMQGIPGFRLSPEYPCCLSKDFQAPGAYSPTQGAPRRAMAFSCSSSFRITATSATFFALPRSHKP